MAKGHRSKRFDSSFAERGRDTKYISRPLGLPLSLKLRDLANFDDARRWRFEAAPTALHVFTRRPATLKVVGPLRLQHRGTQYMDNPLIRAYWNTVPYQIGFVHPKTVGLCIRRKVRREVLHALNVAGKSGLGPPHYNELSKVRC